jgi:peptide/nickel transport system substrate-binding protein
MSQRRSIVNRRPRGSRRFLAALVGLSLVAAACGVDAGGTADGTDPAPAQDTQVSPAATDKPEVVVALSDTVDVIELHTFRSTSAFTITGALYEPLLRQVLVDDGTGLLVGSDEVEGAGAESYEIVETDAGGYLATFNLRPDARFSSGNPVTAADYKYTFDRSIEGPGYIGLLLPFIGIDSTDQIRVIDDLTLEIETTVQSPLFKRFMTFQVFGAIEKAVAEANATPDDPWAFTYFNTNAAGSGPFMVETFTPETAITLVPNPYYWDAENVGASKVTVKNVPDANQRALLLERGELDVADGLPPRVVAGMDGNEAVRVFRTTTTGLVYLGMNQAIPPLDNRDIRAAIRDAVPYDALIEQVMFNQAVPAQGVVTSTMDTFDEEIGTGFRQDLDAARASLEASGETNVTLTLGVRESRASDQEAAILIQDALRQVGITLEIQVLADGDFLTKLRNDELPLFIHDWTSWGEDPFFQMTFLTTCEGRVNYANFCDPAYDEAVKKGTFTTDEVVRQEASSATQQIFFDQAVWAPLYSADRTMVAGACVTGVVRDYTMVLGVKHLAKTEC